MTLQIPRFYYQFILLTLVMLSLSATNLQAENQTDYTKKINRHKVHSDIPFSSDWKNSNSTYYGSGYYREMAGFDPMARIFSGPLLDQMASELERPYNERYGISYTHRNYLYNDWDW